MNRTRTGSRIVSLALAAALLAACGGAEERKAAYLEKGRAYYAEQNYEKARVELKNVLQIDPKAAEPYWLLGQMAEQEKNYRDAFGQYQKVVEFAPDHLDARARLGSFYVLAKDLEKADEHIKKVLAKDPKHIGARTAQAMLLAAREDEAGAIKLLGDVLKDKPDYSEASEMLAGVYLKRKDPDQALAVLKAGIAANPKEVGLRVRLLQMQAALKNPEEAKKIWAEVIALEPDNLSYRVGLAAYHSQLKEFDAAEKILREAIAQKPEDAQRYLMVAQYFVSREQADKGIAELKAAIGKYPENYDLRFGLARLHEQQKQDDEAEKIYRAAIEAEQTEPQGLRARSLLATLLLRQDKRDEALALVDVVLKENPQDNVALLLRARMAMEKKDAATAVTALRSLLKDQPDSPELLTLLAEAHTLNGEPQLAREALQRAAQANHKNPEARLRYAQHLNTAKDYPTARSEIEGLLKDYPEHVGALTLLGEVQVNQGDAKAGEETFQKIKSLAPNDAAGYLGLGRLYQTQRKYDQALLEYETAYQKSPNKEIPLGLIAATHMSDGHPEHSIARLEQANKELPDRAFIHELLAESYQAQKRFADAARELDVVLKLAPKWNMTYIARANLALQQRNAKGAVQAYEAGLAALPGDERLLIGMADAKAASGDPDSAIARYEEALKANPASAARGKLITVLVERKGDTASLKRARALLDEEVKLNPRDVGARLTLAQFLARTKDYDGALREVEEVLKAKTDLLAALQLKAQIQAARGDVAGQEATYNQIAKAHPQTGVGQLALGDLKLKAKQYDAALVAYQAALDQSNDKLRALSGIVNTQLAAGKPEAALARVEDALKQSPDQPALHHMLAEYHLSQQALDPAVAELKRAIALQPKWNVPYQTLGKVELARGNAQAALAAVDAGLKQVPGDAQLLYQRATVLENAGDHEAAIKGYETLLDKQPGHVLATNNLAALLTDFRSDAASFARARDLALPFAGGKQPAGLDTLGWAYYRLGEYDKALPLLQQAVELAPEFAQIRFHLGMTLFKKGDRAAAKVELEKALTGEARFPAADEGRAALKALGS
jgi:tetratricopeptide (TPR) repeat protein